MKAPLMNRALRRKVVNEAVKLREGSKRKKQYGFGIVITNLMFTLTFWRWTIVFYDRRLA